jgi:inward rectifier potassium channel
MNRSSRTNTAPPTRTIGLESHPFQDLYHRVLTSSWTVYFSGFAVLFLLTNALFAALYSLEPGSIANAAPGSFRDAFFFSVQTLATIGYGSMAPATTFGHVVVTLEALVGMLGVAIVTGLTFAKFSRPTSRVIFSNRVVIAPRNGALHLMFRMANARRNLILEAQLRVLLLMEDVSEEGTVMRIPMELPLVRDRTAMFALSWTAMHKITEDSPFFGHDAFAKLRAKKAEFFLTLVGTDETFAQTVHARAHYSLDEIVKNARFKDVLTIDETGTRTVDYRNFHEVEPL